MDHRDRLVDELIRLVTERMEQNRDVVRRSLKRGRVAWRTDKNEKIEVDLEITI